MSGEFFELCSGRLEHISWRIDDSIDSSQVAGVVEGELFVCRVIDVEATLLDEFVEEFAVVDDLVVTSGVGVVMFEAIEAMRAVGDDACDVVLVELGDVCGSQFCEHEFFAHPSSRFSGTAFSFSEHGELDIGGLHQPDHGSSGLAGLSIVGSGAADPVEHIEVGLQFDGWDIESLGPVDAFFGRQSPGVSRASEFSERGGGGASDGSGSDEMSSESDDQFEWIDTQRADFDAGRAGRTRPEGIFRDNVSGEQRCVGEPDRRQLPGEVLDDVSRREWFAGGVGWAFVLATPAGDAGFERHELSDGQVFELAGPVDSGRFDVLDADGIERTELAFWMSCEQHGSGDGVPESG